MRNALNRTARHTEQGQAIVEFALVIPVIMALLLGVYFFARAFQLQQVLNGAAREGARVWAMNPASGAWFFCEGPVCTNNVAEPHNFYQYIKPAVENYIARQGFDKDAVSFYTTQKSLERNQIETEVIRQDADNDRVTVTIYYRYSLPLGGLTNFTELYLRASCTMKRG